MALKIFVSGFLMDKIFLLKIKKRGNTSFTVDGFCGGNGPSDMHDLVLGGFDILNNTVGDYY